MRPIYFSLFLLLLVPTIGDASTPTQTFNFTVSNNTVINFENGAYIIDVIELSPPFYARVNMTFANSSKINNLYDSEAAITFNEIKLRAFDISSTVRISIEFPAGWGYPKTYPIVRPVPPVGVPNIVLTKSVDKPYINVGDVAEFKIIAENTGNATAYNLTLTDQLPNGFSNAPGSRFPPVINNELSAGSRQELYYALKAVDSGTFNIEPATVIYGTRTNKSNSIKITVATVTQDKSNLTSVIVLDKNKIDTDDQVKVTVKISNTGKANAKSVLVDGAPPLGMKIIEGDLRQVYETINPGETKEYRIILQATEAGNFPIHLRIIYNDDPIGITSDSESIDVKEKERNYLYVILPVVAIAFGLVSFAIKRHKEYSY